MVAQEAENICVYYYATELREENPEIVEAKTLKGSLLATI
jgi:hypothetical protein